MDWSRKWKLIWRWSLLASIPITLYWTIWYLIHGNVPSQTLSAPSVLTVVFPYTISRWWDITIGPIWTAAFILFVTAKKVFNNEKEAGAFFGLGLLVGGFMSVLVIIAPPPLLEIPRAKAVTLVLACIGLGGGFLFALFKGMVADWGVAGAVLGAGAVFGIAHGILAGVTNMMVVCGGFVGVLVGAGIRKIFLTLARKATWQAVGRWLTAK